MDMKEMICHRKSCRSFTRKPVDGEMIEKILSYELVPLYADIKVRMDIVGRKQVKCICPWTTPQLIAVYSEEKEGWLENVGFLFQQMDLYLQTLGLGVCWLGMGRMNPKTTTSVEGMQFVIMLAFGYPMMMPLAISRQPISVGKASTNKIIAAIFASPQVTRKANRIDAKNSQPNKINTNNSNIFTLLFFRIFLYHIYLNANPACVFRILLLLFQKSNCQNSFPCSHWHSPPCAFIV